jgi:hypothetical protein
MRIIPGTLASSILPPIAYDSSPSSVAKMNLSPTVSSALCPSITTSPIPSHSLNMGVAVSVLGIASFSVLFGISVRKFRGGSESTDYNVLFTSPGVLLFSSMFNPLILLLSLILVQTVLLLTKMLFSPIRMMLPTPLNSYIIQFREQKIEKGCPCRFVTPRVTPRVYTRCLCLRRVKFMVCVHQLRSLI